MSRDANDQDSFGQGRVAWSPSLVLSVIGICLWQQTLIYGCIHDQCLSLQAKADHGESGNGDSHMRHQWREHIGESVWVGYMQETFWLEETRLLSNKSFDAILWVIYYF